MEYMDYTFSILQPIKLEKNRYTPSLYYFYKRSIFEAHFVKLIKHFNVNLEVYFKYNLKHTLSVLSRSIL